MFIVFKAVWGVVLFSWCVFGVPSAQVAKDDDRFYGKQQHPTQAYASLLYGPQFYLGARVLGKSLEKTGTKRDRVLLVVGEWPDARLKTLRNDGWRVKHVKPVDNPALDTHMSNGINPKFWAVYTKLRIYTLTEYE